MWCTRADWEAALRKADAGSSVCDAPLRPETAPSSDEPIPSSDDNCSAAARRLPPPPPPPPAEAGGARFLVEDGGAGEPELEPRSEIVRTQLLLPPPPLGAAPFLASTAFFCRLVGSFPVATA